MRPIAEFYRVLNDVEIEQLHESAIRLLENPGMRIENSEMLNALAKKGGKVDLTSEIVRFPPRLVDETRSGYHRGNGRTKIEHIHSTHAFGRYINTGIPHRFGDC